MPVRVTRRTKPARSARGKSPARASVAAAMTRRGGPQPGTGVNGSPHGTNRATAAARSGSSNRGSGDKKKKQHPVTRRQRFGQF